MLRASAMCYGVAMLSLEDLILAAFEATASWADQEAMLRGLGFDDAEVEAVRVAVEQRDAEAVMRIVRGPD